MAAARVVDADTARTAIAPLRRLLAATLQLGGLLVTVVGGHQPAVLSISDQHVSINGADAVQPHLFGVTAYEGGGLFNSRANGSAWLRRWGVTSVGLAAEFADFALPANLSEAELRQWLSVDGGGWNAFRDHRSDPAPRHLVAGWLSSIGGGGAEPSLYLYSGLPGVTDPGNPSGQGLPPPVNGTLWGVAAAAAVRLVRLAAAGSSTDVNTVHIGNEPNNFMWKYSNCSSTDASCALWEEFYSAAALTLKRELPGVRIGGPVLCWGPSGYNQLDQPDWYTWFLWSRPTIERGLREKTLDFFDFHAYTSDSLANRLLADVHTVAAMGSASTGGRVLLPSAITETSFVLPTGAVGRGEHFDLRTLPVARDILSLSSHPDKVIARQQHDMGFAPFRFDSVRNHSIFWSQFPSLFVPSLS